MRMQATRLGTTRREKGCPLISLRNFIPPIELKIGMGLENVIPRRVVVVSWVGILPSCPGN